ncbi:hypothetical protein CP965_08805 [Halarcobacter mediterraneus]|uniref:OmpA-like domain-containing protein n=1 Tax=Halarcobacter mediterraneus TaxID=2023153 RepID=A0A4Q1B232_9BACT|nr:OmpA family protein [Halarcobacter mediterraneus]RXK12666.1 hypothetical protein CP965_08805 [Halarcobacter mediterraneus]
MSPGKKIFFLILFLILLIILCVTTHLDSLHKKVYPEAFEEPITTTPMLKEESIQKKEEIVPPLEKDKSLAVKEKPKKEEIKIQKEEKENTIFIEKPDTPLITTDKRYKRTRAEKPIEEMSLDSQLLQIRIRDYVTKYPVVFKKSSNELTQKGLTTISTVVKILNNYPNIKIEVAGHTDAAGSKKYNYNVSVNRAVEVKKQMIEYGFDKNRVKARGYGEYIPLVENSPSGYSKVNRRVEFNIVEE